MDNFIREDLKEFISEKYSKDADNRILISSLKMKPKKTLCLPDPPINFAIPKYPIAEFGCCRHIL